MPLGYDIVANMILLRSSIGIVWMKHLAAGFLKQPFKRFFKRYSCGVQLYKKGKMIRTNNKAEKRFYSKTYKTFFEDFLGLSLTHSFCTKECYFASFAL